MTNREIKPTFQKMLLSGAVLLLLAGSLWGQAGTPAPFHDYVSYVAWMQSHHKAPFLSAALRKSGAVALEAANQTASSHAFLNIKVNQDRNPWAKAGIASAVDPSRPTNWVVMSNDFRENATRIFYHVSTDGGKTWTDDSLMGGADIFFLLSLPLTYQVNPAISFDDAGNSYLSALGANEIEDYTNNYLNLDSEVYEVQGFTHGTYSNVSPNVIDAQSCSGTFGAEFVCNGTLSQPLNATDANTGSPNAGTNYVYYSYFCNLSTSCTDGTATIPSFGSVILESHSPALGQPYSAPALVSGSLASAQFSDMVIDPSGTPHIFFDDYTNAPLINLWESTLTGGVWTVAKTPVAQFLYNGLGNPNWSFTDSGAAAPRCTIHGYTAYCSFSANQVNGGTLAATPSVYLASVNVQSGTSRITRVNNDPISDQKDHFFAAPATTPAGDVYVGWYDNRRDPSGANVEYFVGKSYDQGRNFLIQKAVSDVPFNPCNGLPGCGYFGDYTQLAAGSDGVVHAAWSDTRDGVSMQIWSQTVHF